METESQNAIDFSRRTPFSISVYFWAKVGALVGAWTVGIAGVFVGVIFRLLFGFAIANFSPDAASQASAGTEALMAGAFVGTIGAFAGFIAGWVLALGLATVVFGLKRWTSLSYRIEANTSMKEQP